MIITKDQLTKLINEARDECRDFPHLSVHLPDVMLALEDLLNRNEPNHEPMEWTRLRLDDLLNRANDHLTFFERQEQGEIEDHLLHAILRLMMVWQLRLKLGEEISQN